MDELMVKNASGLELLSIPVQNSVPQLAEYARRFVESGSAEKASFVLYKDGAERNSEHRGILTDDILVEIEPRAIASLKAVPGVKSVEKLPFGGNLFRVVTSIPNTALDIGTAISALPGVAHVAPQIARAHTPHIIPNDPLFEDQIHLQNTGQFGGTRGIDLNVTEVWNKIADTDPGRGRGVTIGIVDSGVELSHPDLVGNARFDVSRDFFDDDPDPSPEYTFEAHGTACAGIAAGVGFNSIGICGVAPEARIAGIRLAEEDEDGFFYFSPLQEALAMGWEPDAIQIKSMSYGSANQAVHLETYAITRTALEAGARDGRGGRGTIYVIAGGNQGYDEDYGAAYGNSNLDGRASSIYTIAVSAVDDRGRWVYSSPGTNLVVCAVDASTTTDLTGEDGYSSGNYTFDFGGTSSTAPQVAGAVALMLARNPNLGWRDVQEILMRTARKNDPTHPNWITNAAGLHFNYYYGAGLVDAAAAVQAAANWSNLGPQRQWSANFPGVPVFVPNNSNAGSTLPVSVNTSITRVEHVEVTINMEHQYIGDIEIELISPSGTKSRLVNQRFADSTDGYLGATFMSVHNWGENPNGTWTLKVYDLAGLDAGILTNARLTLYGTEGTTVLDNIPPTLVVSTGKKLSTPKKKILIQGTASDDVELDRVEWKAKGPWQLAKGGRSWKFKAPLTKRRTVVQVRAIDAAGNPSRVARVTVLRRPPTSPTPGSR